MMSFLNNLFKRSSSHPSSEPQTKSFSQFHWGTTESVAVMGHAGILQVSAFGSFSFSLVDYNLLTTHGFNVKDEASLSELRNHLSALLASNFSDALAQVSSSYSTVEEMTTDLGGFAQETRVRALVEFEKLGLKLDGVSIEGLRS